VCEVSEHWAVPAALLITGPLLLVITYGVHTRSQLLRNTPTSAVGSMAVGGVRLEGTVEAAEGTLTAPLTGEECVVVGYRVREYKRAMSLQKEWRTVEAGTLAVPFYLHDGTGGVLVTPPNGLGGDYISEHGEYDLSHECFERERYDEGDGYPANVGRFLRDHTAVAPTSDHDREIMQKALPVGTDVLVSGDAELADRVDSADPAAEASSLAVTRDADTELYLVSDRSAGQLALSRVAALVMSAVGLGLTVWGLWWLLSALGIGG
jgi:hypothetical protein